MLKSLHWQLPSLKYPRCFGGWVLTKPRLRFQNQAVSQHSERSGSPWAVVLQTIKSGWLKIPPLNTVKFSFVSFHSPLLFCTTTFHLNTLISCRETHPGKCVRLCCSDETLCHPFKLFLPTNNPEGQPLRSLSYLSINFISLPPIRLKKKKWRLPGVNFLNLSLPIMFFSVFPYPFF